MGIGMRSVRTNRPRPSPDTPHHRRSVGGHGGGSHRGVLGDRDRGNCRGGTGNRLRIGCLTTPAALVVVILSASLFPVTTIAAAADVTLTDAVTQALERNYALAAQEHAAAAATWAKRNAIAQLFPSVSIASNYTRLDEETVARANAIGREITMYFPDSTGQLRPFTIEIPQTVFRDGYETSINGQLLLLQPALWNAVSFAGAFQDVAALQLGAARQATAYQTLRAFVELLKARALVDMQGQHLALACESAAQAQRLYEVGRFAEADVLRWRVEEATQRGLLARTTSALKVAALTLENLIGAPPRGTIQPDSLLPDALQREITRYGAMTPSDWEAFLAPPLEELVESNAELHVLDRSVRLAELEHRQSLTAFLPSMTIAGSYGWQNNDTPGLDGENAWSVTAALSLPLFTSLANYSNRQVTKQRLLQTRREVDDAHRAILLNCEVARTAIRSNAEQFRLAETSLASAQRNFEIRKNTFSLGRLTNIEWIDAHVALQGAEQTHTSAYYDLVLAIADYRQSMGRILTLLED